MYCSENLQINETDNQYVYIERNGEMIKSDQEKL